MNAQTIDYKKLQLQVDDHPYPLVFATISGAHLYGFPYLGFAATQWKLFRKEDPPKVKPLLYVYRVLLTGIHLMQTGEVEANLRTLNETAKLPYLDELVERKLAGPEKGRLNAVDVEFHEREYERLVAALESAAEKSTLPERPSG